MTTTWLKRWNNNDYHNSGDLQGHDVTRRKGKWPKHDLTLKGNLWKNGFGQKHGKTIFFPLEMYTPEPGWLQMRIVLFAIFGHSMGFCDNAGITTSVRNFPRNKGLFHMLKGEECSWSRGCRLNHVNSLQFTIVDSDGEMSNYWFSMMTSLDISIWS